MPPKKLTKQQKKNQDPLTCYNYSKPFFKAFIFPSPETEMIVDTSGDVFAKSPVGAVELMLDELDQDTLLQIPDLELLDQDGNPMENQIKTSNDSLRRIVLIRMVTNWDAELIKINTPVSDEYMNLELKDLHEGYQMQMQDYELSQVTLQMSDPAAHHFIVKRFLAKSTDPDRTLGDMPEEFSLF